jgi:hypothetical protein
MCHRLLPAAILSLGFRKVPDARALELEQHLRTQYQGKIFVLRGFYSGGGLRYDAKGVPVDSVASGDWSVDGFVYVGELHVSHQNLEIKESEFWCFPLAMVSICTKKTNSLRRKTRSRF